ncbi:MAG: ferredoxin reductase [Acidimicrobiales bacterium]|nr:ferredoxin reductase [Acidimicrobiales bacterium]
MSTETAARSRSVLRRVIGAIDAATAPHGVDRYLELAAPTWSMTEVRGRIVAANRTTAGSVTLTVKPNANWGGFTAGQHVQLSVEIDGVRHTRFYSMANAATETNVIELTVKAHPNGTVSNFLVTNAQAGLVVGLSAAQGDFVLPTQRPDRILLISGGSGVTPTMSMLRTLVAVGHTGPVTFVHYALTAEDHIYRDEVAALAAANTNVRVVRIYTDAPGTGDGDGFFTASQLEAIEPNWADAEVFVCGPAPLMNAVRAHYTDAGLAHRHHDEAFTLDIVVGESTGGTITFGATGAVATDDGRTLLEQAEAAGLKPESGCRMGICHTCPRLLAAGTVRNVVNGELSEAGTEVRICVSAPVGDVSIDL